MLRVAAAAVVVFGLGAGAMSVLGVWLGGAAEAASLGLVGAGLVGAGHFLGGPPRRRARVSSPTGALLTGVQAEHR
jgi:hypothetical protein